MFIQTATELLFRYVYIFVPLVHLLPLLADEKNLYFKK